MKVYLLFLAIHCVSSQLSAKIDAYCAVLPKRYVRYLRHHRTDCASAVIVREGNLCLPDLG